VARPACRGRRRQRPGDGQRVRDRHVSGGQRRRHHGHDPQDKQAGRYKVVKEDKTTLVITTDKDGPAEPQTFTFMDDKTLKWTVVDGESIVFAKQ
jgi:hypothetical protein